MYEWLWVLLFANPLLIKSCDLSIERDEWFSWAILCWSSIGCVMGFVIWETRCLGMYITYTTRVQDFGCHYDVSMWIELYIDLLIYTKNPLYILNIRLFMELYSLSLIMLGTSIKLVGGCDNSMKILKFIHIFGVKRTIYSLISA